jgi:hypothetical protein
MNKQKYRYLTYTHEQITYVRIACITACLRWSPDRAEAQFHYIIQHTRFLPHHRTPTWIQEDSEGVEKKKSFQNRLRAVSIILWVLQTEEGRNEICWRVSWFVTERESKENSETHKAHNRQRTGWSKHNALDLCFGGVQFESRSGDRLEFFVLSSVPPGNIANWSTTASSWSVILPPDAIQCW